MEEAQAARDAEFVAGLAQEGFEARFLATSRLGSTTHISVLDGDGRACSVTCTNGEGSGVLVPGTGIHLNNVMGEEDLNPLGFFRDPAGAADAVDDGADRRARDRRGGRARARQRGLEPDPLGDPADDRRRPRPRHDRGGGRAGRRGALRGRPRLRRAGDRRRRAAGDGPRRRALPRAATSSSAACRRSSATRPRARCAAPATRAAAAPWWPREGGRRARGASPAGVAAAAALALLAGGCGGEAGDLMLVQRSGDIPGARLSLRFTEDGRVGCDRGALRELTSPQTIDGARPAPALRRRRAPGAGHAPPAARARPGVGPALPRRDEGGRRRLQRHVAGADAGLLRDGEADARRGAPGLPAAALADSWRAGRLRVTAAPGSG